MKIKTSELTGAALDWAVAKCEGQRLYKYSDGKIVVRGGFVFSFAEDWVKYSPSTDWAQGGPIIEREYISVCAHLVGRWNAYLPNEKASLEFLRSGPTPLVAAMRCYVASKLGDEVEVPDGIKP